MTTVHPDGKINLTKMWRSAILNYDVGGGSRYMKKIYRVGGDICSPREAAVIQ